MNIIFSVVNTGCGNNGGSQSIIRMSNELSKLGHNVKIISNCKNCFTWEPTEVEHFVVSNDVNKWPESDIIISTGVHSISPTIKYSEKTGSKHLSWIRGLERWQMPEKDIIKLYSHPNIKLLCNSEWLTEYIANHTRKKCRLVYSGIPYEKFQDFGKKKTGKTVIGGLAHFTKNTKNWKTFLNLASRIKIKSLRNIEFIAMGDSSLGNNSIINKYICQPSFEDKVKFYNEVDIWVATSILESLHVCPLEAGLCGAAIIVPNVIESGTFDYAIQDYTSYRYNPDKIEDLERWVLHLMMDKKKMELFSENLKSLVRNKIGNVNDNAKRMEKILSE